MSQRGLATSLITILTLACPWTAVGQTTSESSNIEWWTGYHNDSTRFLEAGSAGAMGRIMGMEQLPFWRRLTWHPAHDD